MIHVVLVDDHTLVRSGIKILLDGVFNIKVVGEASTGEEASQVVRQTNPHVVLMDIHLPGLSGLETTQKLLRINPDLKILVLTASNNNDIFLAQMLKTGVTGYILKGTSQEKMIEAIRCVANGENYLSPDVAHQLALKKISGNQSLLDKLSTREFEIMMMITRGIKVDVIATKLHLSVKTINSYRYKIFDKLEIKNDIELTHLAIRYGLIENDTIKS